MSINKIKSKTIDTLEVQIVSFLRRNRGRPCTKEEITAGLSFLPFNFYRVKSVESLTDTLSNVSVMWLVQEAIKQLLKEEKIIVRRVKTKLEEETFYMVL
ncbi:MAG: hypothetical protein L6M37_02585 [Candidatus Methylarchaceae archaeon HK02M1]|nr:hypothetical protein [Candidatus Methylarchaceae archaeon HK02M1]